MTDPPDKPVPGSTAGSGGGIKRIEARSVDFGAADAPLEGEDLDRLAPVRFPTVMGGVVAVAYGRGVTPSRLELTGELLADIFHARITRWGDPKIAAPNPGLTPVGRSNVPGATRAANARLAEVSQSWNTALGAGDVRGFGRTGTDRGGHSGSEGEGTTLHEVVSSRSGA